MNLLFRTGSWWKKLSSFMTIVYFQLWVNTEITFGNSLKSIFIVIIGLVFGAILTSFINNYYDIECDSRAGKQNFFATAQISRVYKLMGLSVAGSTLFLMSIYPNKAAIVFFLLAVLCVWLYSSNITRFKERPPLDLIFDGLGTQFFPALFCFAIVNFGQEVSNPHSVLLGSVWLFFSNGIRALIIHQTRDKEEDMKAGLRTFINVFPEKALTTIKTLLIICEIGFWSSYLLSVDYGVSGLVFVLFVTFSVFVAVINKGMPYVVFSLPRSKKQRILLFDLYFILPVIALTVLSVSEARYFWVLIIHILLFHYGLISAVLSKTLR